MWARELKQTIESAMSHDKQGLRSCNMATMGKIQEVIHEGTPGNMRKVK